jgi:hypothetical protein
MTREQSTDGGSQKTVCSTICGAWSEALSHGGGWGVFLTAAMFVMTVPFAPFWMTLTAVEAAGYYEIGEGFQL